MKFSSTIGLSIAALLLSGFALLGGCSGSKSPAGAEETGRGPHGGRLLVDSGFALELAIFETGVPPEYRAWATVDGKAIPPSQVKLVVQLERFAAEMNRIEFAAQDDFLRSTSEVYEPHSFNVTVQAEAAGKSHQWRYESLEGRVQIAAAMATEAGVVVETAGPRTIRDGLPLHGVIIANPESVRAVSARYPGPIRSVAKSLGDAVNRGEVLATVESNESLQTYPVTAPISGVITARNANPGEVAAGEPLFVITDLTKVAADLSVFARDLPRLSKGQRARIQAVDGSLEGEGEVVFVSPAGAGMNQAVIARVRLDNPQRRWTPGVFVSAELYVTGTDAPVAVKVDALQRFRDWQVVFRNQGELYQVQPVETGRSDGEWIEITQGLPVGAPYVAANSFLIKAHIEKSSASHDH